MCAWQRLQWEKRNRNYFQGVCKKMWLFRGNDGVGEAAVSIEVDISPFFPRSIEGRAIDRPYLRLCDENAYIIDSLHCFPTLQSRIHTQHWTPRSPSPCESWRICETGGHISFSIARSQWLSLLLSLTSLPEVSSAERARSYGPKSGGGVKIYVIGEERTLRTRRRRRGKRTRR